MPFKERLNLSEFLHGVWQGFKSLKAKDYLYLDPKATTYLSIHLSMFLYMYVCIYLNICIKVYTYRFINIYHIGAMPQNALCRYLDPQGIEDLVMQRAEFMEV